MGSLVRSPFIHRPKNLSELEKIFFSKENPTIFAGGTHLMHYPESYSNCTDIIDLYANPKLLMGVYKSLDFIEIEANCRLESLIDENIPLPSVIKTSLKDKIPYSIRQIVSIAGCVASKEIKYDISASLVACKTMCDIRYFQDKGIKSDRVLLENLFSTDKEEYKKILIEKFIIPRQDRQKNQDNQNKYVSFYKSYSNSYFKPKESFVIAGYYFKDVNDDELSRSSLVVLYPNISCHSLQKTANLLNDTCPNLLKSTTISAIKKSFDAELEKYFPNDPRNPIASLYFDTVLENIQFKIL